VDAFMCYKQKCKVVSLNLAHPVDNERFHLTTQNILLYQLLSTSTTISGTPIHSNDVNNL